MPTHQPLEFPITWNQVAAFRLSRHHLMKRAPANAFASVAGDMVGVQAQRLSAAPHGAPKKGSAGPAGRVCLTKIIDAAIDATLGVLDQPLTRPEIAERVSRVLGRASAGRPGRGLGNRREVPAVPVGELNFPVAYFSSSRPRAVLSARVLTAGTSEPSASGRRMDPQIGKMYRGKKPKLPFYAGTCALMARRQ